MLTLFLVIVFQALTHSNKWEYCGPNSEGRSFPGECFKTNTPPVDTGDTTTSRDHQAGVEYYLYTQAFQTDVSFKISEEHVTDLASSPIIAKVSVIEENNPPSMPKLICPKGELSYVGCFQTDFRFSLPREICHQKFKNDGHKCDFVGGNVRSYPTISSLESCQEQCYNDPLCVTGKWEDSWKIMYKIDESNNMMENVGKVSFNAAFWSSEFRILKRTCQLCSEEDYKEIYYARDIYENENAVDVYDELMHTFMAVAQPSDDFNSDEMFNRFGFNLYSTLEDAINRNNPWEYCNGGSENEIFPRECGKTGKWTGSTQSSNVAFEWSLYTLGGGCVLGSGIKGTPNECDTTCTSFQKEGNSTPFSTATGGASTKHTTLASCKFACKGSRYVALTRSNETSSCNFENT